MAAEGRGSQNSEVEMPRGSGTPRGTSVAPPGAPPAQPPSVPRPTGKATAKMPVSRLKAHDTSPTHKSCGGPSPLTPGDADPESCAQVQFPRRGAPPRTPSTLLLAAPGHLDCLQPTPCPLLPSAGWLVAAGHSARDVAAPREPLPHAAVRRDQARLIAREQRVGHQAVRASRPLRPCAHGAARLQHPSPPPLPFRQVGGGVRPVPRGGARLPRQGRRQEERRHVAARHAHHRHEDRLVGRHAPVRGKR